VTGVLMGTAALAEAWNPRLAAAERRMETYGEQNVSEETMVSVAIVMCVVLLIWIGLGKPRRIGRSQPQLARERSRTSSPSRAGVAPAESGAPMHRTLDNPRSRSRDTTPGGGNRARVSGGGSEPSIDRSGDATPHSAET
jgi:hypothetical protein